MLDPERRDEVLAFYDACTKAFQGAYERFAEAPEAGPDATLTTTPCACSSRLPASITTPCRPISRA